MIRPLLAGALAGVVTFLLAPAVLAFNAFGQLAVAGCTDLVDYLTTAILRENLRVWVSANRPTKRPMNPATR
jgi:hypothetical protein